jgi:filamentous hemagglutinin
MKSTKLQALSLRFPRATTSCSLLVLAALGLLSYLPQARAQTKALPPGTLPVLRGVVSGQATFQAPTPGSARPTLTINQATQRAILDWNSFNVSRDSEVRFNQPSSTASVLNRIYSADPSVIQGRISANGQVLLINQNGILFDRGAQINMQSLVASTLNISNDRFNSGALTTGGLTTPAFAGGYDAQGNTLPGSLPPGSIILGGSGTDPLPSLEARPGGSIILVAPRIENQNALITAPDGQVILAAGGKVYFTLPDDRDTTLRGLRVEVEAPEGSSVNLSSLIRNLGTISADRGNVTLAGLAVNQDGRVSANTAVQANGSIYLQARSQASATVAAQAGSVTFGRGSVTQVLPDGADRSTLPESENYATRRGVIQAEGRTIESHGTLAAAGGRITLNAADASDPTAARVYLGEGSVTSVAGNWADLAADSNLLTFRVTSNELKDSPDQRNGVLRGASVTVDLRKANPIFDLSGYINGKARTVSEKAAVGGELLVASSGSVVQRSGATLDASGGGYRYADGAVATSRLLGDDGRLYDIGTAAKDRSYTSVADTFTKTYDRWGQNIVYNGLLYGLAQREAAYVEGKAGGSILVNSGAGLVLDGTLKGGSTVGPNQLARAPRGATLKIGSLNNEGTDFVEGQRIGNVSFGQTAVDTLGAGFGIDTALSQSQKDQVRLAASQLFGAPTVVAANTLQQSAFGSVEVNSNGKVFVPGGVSIKGAPGSSLLLRAPTLEVAGSIDMPAGRITLQPQLTVDAINATDSFGTTVRSGARLSTNGVWVNTASADGSFVGGVLPTGLLNADGSASSTLNGGSITVAGPLNSTTRLERGSTLDVGGGAALDRNRRVTGGNGGSISLTNALSEDLTSDWLQADLQAYAVGNGGSLSVTTPRVVIDAPGANGTLQANTTRLSTELFAEHGFSNFQISAGEGISIRAGADLAVSQKNLVIDPLAAPNLPTGGDLASVTKVERLPDSLRQAANLSLTAANALGVPATLTLDAGASITTDPRGRVALRANDGMQIDGRIVAPGGNVSLRLAAPTLVETPDLSLGSAAEISVAGTFVRRPNDSGLVQGSVIGAGTITLESSNTGIQLAAGSRLDLNGVSQVVDEVDPTQPSGRSSRQLDGNAGTLVIKSQNAARLDGTITAAKASASSAGGSFALELTTPSGLTTQPDPRRIVVTQAATSLTAEAGYVDSAIAIDPLKQAGFDKLRLLAENSIRFDSDASLAFERGVRLDAPLLDVRNDSNVSVTAASVGLVQSQGPRILQGVTYEVVPTAPSPVLDTRTGGGTLTVQAGTIDLLGSTTVNGVAETRLEAQGDIQLSGRKIEGITGTVGGLTTAGNLSLTAAQVYPSTRTDFSFNVVEQPSGAVVPGGVIRVAPSGRAAADVYSAGGKLTFKADTIVQGGTVKVPQGELNLLAQSRLELAPGSLTSVSADGITVPLGRTNAGLTWVYADGPSFNNILSAPSSVAKGIQLAGQQVDVRPNATVDISGGGEVQAIEFVPGTGGSTDTLLKPNTFAIIPKSRLTSMPVETDIASRQDLGFGLLTSNPDTSVYNSLYIGAGAVVPEGEYALLPGRYALVPGAFLVQLQTGSTFSNMKPGQTTPLLNGQTVVAGYRTAAGTNVRESTTVGVLVRPGSDALRESDYTLTDSAFFAAAATRDRKPVPRLPIDAGRLTIADVSALTLDGSFRTQAGAVTGATGTRTGRSATVDLSAERIAVVDTVGQAGVDADYLQLNASRISRIGGSVLIGGRRSDNADGSTQITTGASRVLVANEATTELRAPELLIAASEDIEVREGSLITGAGVAAVGETPTYRTEAGGALLRLSSGPQAEVDRGGSTNRSVGTISVAQGATLQADGALLLDATSSTRSQGNLLVGRSTLVNNQTKRVGGDLSLASSQVSLGQIDGIAGLDSGLALSNANLLALTSVDSLTIKGYDGIDLFGSAVLGSTDLGRLTLDANALRGLAVSGAGPSAPTIAAREVRLVNTGSTAPLASTESVGELKISAERLILGQGDKTISGFASVTTAASEIRGEDQGSLQVAADWTLQAPRVGVAAGAQQTWQAVDGRSGTADYRAMTVEKPVGGSGTAVIDSQAAGGRLSLEGRSVDVTTTIQARSGEIAIAAKGSDADTGSVTLGAGALLDVRGVAKNYNGKQAVASAGRVDLASDAGAVTIADGAVVDVRGVAGGSAGSVQVAAQTLALDGSLRGSAEAGGAGGRFELDAGTLAEFSDINTALNDGGFNARRDIRVRSGDLRVQSTDMVTAREISLAADAGRIDIEGTLNARSVEGGAKVDVWAANGLALTGARVWADGTSTDASAQAPAAHGGQVRLSTTRGALSFDAASEIDVRPGAKGRTGSVTFTVARDAANVVAPVALAGTVRGVRGGNGSAADVALQAQRVYQAAGSISASSIAGYAANHAAFIAAANPALMAGLKGDVRASVRGATEIQAQGNLTLAQAWDLTTSQWLATGASGAATTGRTGTLSLRAAGDLTVSRALGNPNDNLLAGDSWNLRLVGGADLGAANPLATQRSLTAQALESGAGASSGNVTISTDGGKVRTGTGSIEIAAAADFRMDALRSVVYTAGKIGAADTEANGNNRWAKEGGSISIAAGRDAVGKSDQWITEWLRRPRTSINGTANADWWAYRPNFQQGVGTLGGGDIQLAAGRNVDGLSAMLPTSGRNVVQGSGTVLDVQGGGDLRVTAGGDVKGGSYLVGRGTGRIEAGGAVGSGARTQLYLQGTSSGDVPAEATLQVEAGGAVALQSVNDPTAVWMNNSRAEDRAAAGSQPNCISCGPSFTGTGSNVRTFFTYSGNSGVEVTAKSGDVVLGSQLAAARTLLPAQAIGNVQLVGSGAYPASIRAAAFEGDISNDNVDGIVSFPSASAQVAMLAQGSLRDLRFSGSDRLPSAVPNPTLPSRAARSLSGSALAPVAGESRIVTRDAVDGYTFDFQALTGNVTSTTTNPVTMSLPAVSRVNAGQDITNVELLLQNLNDADVSVVKAESGDVRPIGIEIRGPGRLLVQAGRNIDLGEADIIRGSSRLGGVISTGNVFNPSLGSDKGALVTLIAGATGNVDLAKLDATYAKITGISASNPDVFKLFRLLDTDPQQARVLSANSVAELAAVDPAYAPYTALASEYPQLLAAYQQAASSPLGGPKALPLGGAALQPQVESLYALLNGESNRQAILAAGSVADLVSGTQGGSAYLAYAELDRNYPRVLDEYQLRLGNGVPLPLTLDPVRVVYADVFKSVIAEAIPQASVVQGDISSYLTSIQSYAGGGIELWAPNGKVVVGLTTPAEGRTIGVLTNAGGGIRSVVGGNFSINQGKVLTAQGGDILILSTDANIDAGRGAQTSLSTPPPTRTPILVTPEGAAEPVVVGFTYTLPASAAGSGIQTLTSDPDGLGPLTAPSAGSTTLITLAGVVDAGEAGIRSGGAIFVDAQAVLNGSNISSGGPSVGVPVSVAGSLASSVATSGSNTQSGGNSADEAGKAAAAAAKAASAEGLQKPTILTVEVLGFGDKNCKEQQKDCFVK